jgi:hypothetical protein
MTLLPRQIAHHAPGPGLQPTRCLCAKARVAPCILSEVWRLQAARLQAAGSRSAYCLSARWGCRTACGPSAQHPTHGAHAKRRRLAARPERVRTSTETISTMMSCTAQRGVRAPPWGQHLQPCHEMVAKHSHSDRGLRCSWACQGAQRPRVCVSGTAHARCLSGHWERWRSASAGEHLVVVHSWRLALAARLGARGARRSVLRAGAHPASARGRARTTERSGTTSCCCIARRLARGCHAHLAHGKAREI